MFLGWRTKAKVVKVIDGDTIRVEVTRVLDVRLIDCWVKDKTPLDDAAREVLESFGKDVILEIPSSDDHEIKDEFTFGRVLGHILRHDGTNVGKYLCDIGLATPRKPIE